jgi:hypothetical protein
MVAHLLILLEATPQSEVVTLLLPMLPLPTVLVLERWVLSNFSFLSPWHVRAFRGAYLISVFCPFI